MMFVSISFVLGSHSFQWNIGFRDWSLITGRGGATKQEGGGAREVLPLRKGGAEKVLAMHKGGHKKFWGSFPRWLEVLAIL